jgi:hypothetical protein
MNAIPVAQLKADFSAILFQIEQTAVRCDCAVWSPT